MKRRFGFLMAVAMAATAGAVTFRRPLDRVSSLDPLRGGAVWDAMAIMLVYEAPLEVDYYARPYRLKPSLCSLPEVSSDGLEYVFTIREGAEFHAHECLGGKSRPLVAADMVYSLLRLADKANASSGMWTMDAVARDPQSGRPSVVALDDRRVKITLKAPQYVFPWLMALPYAGVVAHEAVEKYGSHFGGVAVGSGPYCLAEWWRNHRMRFERVPGWGRWQATNAHPYDMLEFVVVDDASTQWLMFLSGEVDMLRGIATDNWDAVVGADGKLMPELAKQGVELYAVSVMETCYLGVNMKDPVLGPNKKLRQALNCAFDFEAWNRFRNNRLLPASGPVPPGVVGRLETPFAYSHDVEKAKRLLAEAGYPNGIDPKTNRRLEITVSCGRANQEVREEIELIQSFYSEIGIQLKPDYKTWNAFQQCVAEGRVTLFLMEWIGDYPDAENFMQLFHTKNCSPGSNHGCYSNPEFDKIYDQAMATRDANARNQLWHRAQEIIREDCPWVFLNHTKRYSLAWNHVGNYIPSDFPHGVEKYFYKQTEGSRPVK